MNKQKVKLNTKKENLSTFADRLQYIIRMSSLEKQALAEIGAVSASSVTKYLKGENNPSQDTLALWANALNINLNWLVIGEGEMLRTDAPVPAGHDETAALRQRIADLEKTIAAQDETLALYRRMETPDTTEGKETAAPGSGSAAPSKHCPIK